jgi:hypothetical protein
VGSEPCAYQPQLYVGLIVELRESWIDGFGRGRISWVSWAVAEAMRTSIRGVNHHSELHELHETQD